MSSNKSDSENDDISGPKPRLCHLRKWPHFQGYGFNLHAEKTRNGQSIGKVDPNSPAESAGLKEKDRIIEVNYVNISNENHQQVVKRIRNGLELNGQVIDNEVVLLVVDPEADEYYKKRNIVVKHDFKNVLRLETPPEPQLNNNRLLPPESSPQVSSHRNSISSTSEHNNSTEINNNNFEKTSNDYRYNTNTSQNNEKVSTPLIQDKLSNYEKVSPPQTPLSTKSNGSVSSSNKDTQSNKSSSTNTMNHNNNNNNNHSNNSSNNNNSNANAFDYRDRRTPRTSNRYDQESRPTFTIPQVVEPKDPNATPKLETRNTSCSNLVSLAFKDKAFEAVHQMLDASTSSSHHDNTEHHLNKKENSFLSNLSHLHITTPKTKKKNDNNSHNLPSSYSSASLSNGHSFHSSSTGTNFSRQHAPNESRLNDIVFTMSAAEYKAFLKTNKQKSDPRNVHVDIKQKYQIFQNM